MPNDFNPFTETLVSEYFVGREDQLRVFRTNLNGLRQKVPSHVFVAGLEGTGKSWYLAKLAEIAQSEDFLAPPPESLDPKSFGARAHISTILRSLIGAVENHSKDHSLSIVADWDKGKDSRLFQHPRADDLNTARINQDFETLARIMKEEKIPGAVVCVDEGQRIHGLALSALKNALQRLNSFLIVLSLRIVSDENGAVAAGRDLLNDRAATEAEGDMGASRFFVNGVPLGPFDTDEEADRCIEKRLVDNVITFDGDVVRRIGRINDRVPKSMIRFAHRIYNDALGDGSKVVDVGLLNKAFRRSDDYRTKVADALMLIENSSENVRAPLRGLLELRQPATAATIAGKLYPRAESEMLEILSASFKSALDRVCSDVGYCTKSEDRYDIPDPVYAYALELALERL